MCVISACCSGVTKIKSLLSSTRWLFWYWRQLSSCLPCAREKLFSSASNSTPIPEPLTEMITVRLQRPWPCSLISPRRTCGISSKQFHTYSPEPRGREGEIPNRPSFSSPSSTLKSQEDFVLTTCILFEPCGFLGGLEILLRGNW